MHGVIGYSFSVGIPGIISPISSILLIFQSISDLSTLSVAPFVLLLLAIAVMPLINKEWWERYYPFFSFGFAALTILYYLVSVGDLSREYRTFNDYISFIVLLASLFIVSGGIVIRLRGKSNPVSNTLTLLIGAIISNVVGTTGASMIMIRPYLNVNKNRLKPFHIIFFIFLVGNIGGALTPIGDPPLFLGYLIGVPFFWAVKNLWVIWVFALAVLLILFFIIDSISFKKILREQHLAPSVEFHEEAQVRGLQNTFFIAIILIAVFIREPKYIREIIMICAAAGSYITTRKDIHKQNNFAFHPIVEVAILFFGIFITMVPALDLLEAHAAAIGLKTAGAYYWATGGLSSVLDNAPTYYNFLHAAIGLNVTPEAVSQVQNLITAKGNAAMQMAPDIQRAMQVLLANQSESVAAGVVSVENIRISYLIANSEIYLKAVSIGAVFFGAMTYIGNGPNFMIKSIAEQHHTKCPSFIEYITRYSIPILLPLFFVIWLVFF
ncbi:MAG: sodium:proton antiporter [Bacteroidota bacterium]